MSGALRGYKFRAGHLALCLTIAAAMFAVLDSGALAGATTTNPTITGISPRHSAVTGGVAFTITGTGFESGATVVVGQGARSGAGAIAATDVVVVSSTEITAVTGGGAKSGVYGTYVVNPDGGVSAGTFSSLFAYDPLPTISNLSPRTGPTSGGTAITITGTGFQSGATVVIAQGNGAGAGAIPATNVVVVSSSEITAVTGSGAAAGTWQVFVLNPDDGVSPASVASFFTYSS